ncbi:MAG: hypothetical protein K8M05_41620 [Deltaproteobacteria bacterium]|nr:hypothetical protein [Kofleriaceae bacterium]
MIRAVVLGVAVGVAVLVAACFEPDYPRGLACSSGGTCPPGQVCNGFVCVAGGGVIAPDGGFGEVDGGGGVCQLAQQTGCPPGYKCTFTGSGVPNQGECRPNGFLGLGEACNVDAFGNDECAAGSLCVFNECTALCAGLDSCFSTHACVDAVGYSVCLRRCDPLAQDCAPPAEGPAPSCFVTPTGSACAVPSRYLDEGAECNAFNDCRGGFSCAGGFCRRNCDVRSPSGDPGSCPTKQLCSSVTDPYGVCL